MDASRAPRTIGFETLFFVKGVKMNSKAGWKPRGIISFFCVLCGCLLLVASATAAPGSNEGNPLEPDSAAAQPLASSSAGNQSEINELKRQMAELQKQIEELRLTLQKQTSLSGDSSATPGSGTQPPVPAGSTVAGGIASMAPMLPSSSTVANQAVTAFKPGPSTPIQSAAPKNELPAALKGFKPIGTFYLSYQAGTQNSGTNQTAGYNSFQLKRGYFGAEVDLTSYLSSRFVGDITLDSLGDVKVRAKYLYAKFHGKGNGVISQPYMELGLAHMPWLDFEEALNGFRMQDTMFAERNNIFNSADIGVLVGSDIGGSLSGDYKSSVNSKYAGRYGSWQVGVYNGGGYHAAENNTNKVFEARLSIRPVPHALPGLQFTAFGSVGKGNKVATSPSEPPDWKSSIGMISYESRYFTFGGQGYLGIGNQGGSALESNGTSAHQKGFSVFASVHIPTPHFGQKISLIGRLDEFNSNTRIYNDLQRRYTTGIAWHIYKENTWLVDYQRTQHSLSTLSGENRLQVTLQTAF
jgi:hypothetical protein